MEFMIQDWDHTVTTDPMIEICIVRFKFKKAAIHKTKFVFGFKWHGNESASNGIVISIKEVVGRVDNKNKFYSRTFKRSLF